MRIAINQAKLFIERVLNAGRALPAIRPLGGQCPPYKDLLDSGRPHGRDSRGVFVLFTITLAALVGGCADLQSDAPPTPIAATAPTTQPVDPAWPGIAKALERPGVLKDGIYTITIPRDDLDVTIDGMGIPTGAGIESIFYFYRCPCGKMNVAGQFVTADYESNDVVDALRKNAAMNVASIAPLLLYAKPNLTAIRFQAEGDPVVMAGILREALRWTGKERMAPEPLPKTP